DDDATTPSPVLQTPTTTDDDGPNACGATEEFQISSPAIPEAVGCYQATSVSFSYPNSTIEVWTADGTASSGQVWVLGNADDGAGDADGWTSLSIFDLSCSLLGRFCSKVEPLSLVVETPKRLARRYSSSSSCPHVCLVFT
ncbi:unnamed protein product, partial [Pylaiella littoralis]